MPIARFMTHAAIVLMALPLALHAPSGSAQTDGRLASELPPIPSFLLARSGDQIHLDERQADRALNATYQRLMRQIDSGKSALSRERVIVMQRAWIVYRDALAELEGSLYAGGSLQSQTIMTKKDQLTQQQIKHLERLMEGI